jgi:hypothetical protein
MVSKSILRNQFRDIRNHGFNSLAIYERDTNKLKEMMEIIKEMNFEKPIMIIWDQKNIDDDLKLETAKKILDESGANYYFYSIDEPNTKDKIEKHLKTMKRLHKKGLKVSTAIRIPINDRLKKEDSLDWANYTIINKDLDLYMENIGMGEKLSPLQTIYFGSYFESFFMPRFYAGIFLWKSGFEGAYGYCYQAFHTVDPYQKDFRSHNGKKSGKKRYFKCFCTTYPTRGKPIPTIQWEAFREGIDDLRYLQLADTMIKNLAKRGKIDESVSLKMGIEKLLTDFDYRDVPFEPNSDEIQKFHLFRENMIEQLRRYESFS